ncbi:Cryptic beta-glucoside bgl operon antiterminator (plasmid) [Klebsiella variicola]|uniref:Cryptic beta-glucoside bgl operon antiterminator n=1 Tax=Klebsiella variicola TaxID=244366 RepID=A0A9P0YBT2_KLEVA|nr:Cryptic beta-glucoside bgl operon antiterminator [Klebsiella variicola]
MKIAKILNNNIVTVIDGNNNESVVMGRGLGFKKHSGDLVDETLIERVFVMKPGELTSRLQEILSEIPMDVITTTDKIILLAKERLPGKLQHSVYISLTDHCHFAIERHK